MVTDKTTYHKEIAMACCRGLWILKPEWVFFLFVQIVLIISTNYEAFKNYISFKGTIVSYLVSLNSPKFCHIPMRMPILIYFSILNFCTTETTSSDTAILMFPKIKNEFR